MKIKNEQLKTKRNNRINQWKERKQTSKEEKRTDIKNPKNGIEPDTTFASKTLAFHSKIQQTVDLDDKVDEFIKWYTSYIGERNSSEKMRNLIEKIAVWYELRYPDYEINRIMHCTGQEPQKISDEMFNQNKYINQQLTKESEVRILDWDEFYNPKAFIHSLPSNEKYYFLKPQYKEIVYWDYGHSSAHLHLSKKGTVEISELMNTVIPGISDSDLEGKNIKEIVKMIQRKGIDFPENNEFITSIQNYDNWMFQKEEMLNCIMYRIIKRGGNRLGPRRAFLFAKEFKRNMDIPMMYGIDYSDPGLRLWINEYLKSGGSKDLVCYVNYFSKTNPLEKLNTVTINELLKTLWNSAATKYTEEESKLHQRLIDILISERNQKDMIQEEKKRKLEREN